MNKRLLCFLALLLTAVMGVWADEFVVDNVRYTITSEDPNEVTVSGYDGDLPASLVIPASVTYNTTDYAVTTIDDDAFSDCTSLSSITLAEGLTTIGGYAFYNCGTTIESVTIPESVTSIGDNAFNGTNVTNFYINNIPSKIAIGETPFKADGVTIHVFTQMQSTFENATNWSAYTGHFNADIAISHVQSITLDNESMIMKTNTSGKLNATINPADARVKDVVFTSSNDNIIHITNAATGEFEAGSTDGNATITCTAMDGSGKYASCTVTVRNIFTPAESVTLNMSEKSIEVGKTFKLIATINPANATYKDVTWRSSDENVATVDNSGYVTAIAPGVATITAISHDGQARANCVVTVVDSGSCGTGVTWTLTGTSPNYTLTISGTGAIQDAVWGTMPWNSYKSSITTLIIEDGVTSIGVQAFKNHENLASINIANSVTTIGGKAFERCFGLTEFTVPDGVTNIDGGAFNQCLNMETFNIGTGLASINNSGIFLECDKLATFTVAAGNTAFKAEDGVLLTYDGTELVAYPAAKTATTYTIPDDVTTIWDYAFYQCTKLTEVTFPASATIIGYSAFDFCTALATVTFEAGSQLATIDDYAFDSCFSLSSITIPASVTSIGERAFYDCSALVTVTMLPATPPFLGSDALVIGGSNTNKKFYFHGTAYGTDTYPDWNDMYNNTGSFSSWTTTVIGTLTLSEGTTTSTAAFVSDATSNYYTEGTTITLGHGEAPEGKVFAGYTVKDANDNDVTVTENEGVYTFDMPAGDVTATVNWREIIPYIDADGNTAYCTDYTVLDNTMTTISAGWYVVNSDVTISGNLSTNVSSSGEVNIILCDGATLTASNITPINDRDFLRIYGQSQGTGTASISGNINASSSLKIYGGTINVTGTIMCHQSGVGIYGGNVTATDINGFEGDLYLKDGIITVGRLTVNQGNIILAGATVKSNSYNASNGNVTILPGITYYNGSEVLTGTVSEMSKLNGMTLSPAVPYIDADGTTAYCTDFTVLTGSTKSVTLGSDGETTWYVVNSDVNYKTILLIGNVNIILCDGMTMTANGGSASAIRRYKSYNNSLTIYGQSAGTGKLKAQCGEGYGISSNAITINGGTVDANGSNYPDYSAIYASGNVTISGGNVRATGYPKGIEAGGTITLGWTNATDRIYASSYSGTVIVKDGQVFTDGNGNNFFGTITDVSTIADKTLQPAANSVFYIDEDGTTKCCTNYKVLTGEESELDGGWYVVNDDVTYTGTVTLNGDVNIILCDSKTMNIGTKQSRISDSGICEYDNTLRILNIYGQSGQTGRLNVYNDDSNKAAVDLKSYNQYGGNVNIDANHTALSLHDSDGTFELSLQRGTLTVTAANGKDAIKCNTVVYGVLMEGGTLAATSIGGTAINGRVNFRGGTLTANGGDSGCGISGYVSLIPYSGFDSFTASSFNSDVSIAYGKSVSDGTTIYTNSNQSEIKSLKNVTLTLPTCSMTGNSVVTGEYWSTFYHPTAGYQVDANTTTAYIATLNSEETALTLTEVEGGFIPAGHAVILKSTTSSYDIDRAETGDAFDFTTNSLLGGGKVNPTYDVYTLAAKDGVVGFYKFTGTSLNPYKAHLECAPADSRDYYGLEDDGTTRIEPPTISPEGERPDVWYDLNGRRIEKPTRKGIYIHNGRKEVLK